MAFLRIQTLTLNGYEHLFLYYWLFLYNSFALVLPAHVLIILKILQIYVVIYYSDFNRYIITFLAENVSAIYVFNDLISARESAEHQLSRNSELQKCCMGALSGSQYCSFHLLGFIRLEMLCWRLWRENILRFSPHRIFTQSVV